MTATKTAEKPRAQVPPAQQTGGSLVAKDQRMGRVAKVLYSDAMKKQMAHVLPKHVTPERMARLVLTECQRVPQLLDCEPLSLLGSMMTAAALGLQVGVRGECWILPFQNKRKGITEATFVPGYLGLVQLAYRSKLVAAITAHCVYDGDPFTFDDAENALTFRRGTEHGRDPARIMWAFARVWSVMSPSRPASQAVLERHEIEAIRQRSPSARAPMSPWLTDYDPMACKTALKRALKLAPASQELSRALELDDAADAGLPQMFDELGLEDVLAAAKDVTPKADAPAPPAEPDEPEEIDPETGEVIPRAAGVR